MLEIVEGWTGRIGYTLEADGAAVDLTGCTVVLSIRDRNGILREVAGSFGIDDATTGKVYFDPNAADIEFNLSPFSIRWKVTDGTNKVTYFPNGAAEAWIIYPA